MSEDCPATNETISKNLLVETKHHLSAKKLYCIHPLHNLKNIYCAKIEVIILIMVTFPLIVFKVW